MISLVVTASTSPPETKMDSTFAAQVHEESAASRAVSGTLIHEYSRRYIADSPQRMKQLLAACQSESDQVAELEAVVDEFS